MKSDLVRLGHIVLAINEIEAFLADTPSYEDFTEDYKTFSAVLMQLVIIGEATKALSRGFTSSHADSVEFRKIVGMRNILTHEYFGVDKKIVWEICQTDLPELKNFIQAIIQAGEVD